MSVEDLRQAGTSEGTAAGVSTPIPEDLSPVDVGQTDTDKTRLAAAREHLIQKSENAQGGKTETPSTAKRKRRGGIFAGAGGGAGAALGWTAAGSTAAGAAVTAEGMRTGALAQAGGAGFWAGLFKGLGLLELTLGFPYIVGWIAEQIRKQVGSGGGGGSKSSGASSSGGGH
jgi:hypothetical protein